LIFGRSITGLPRFIDIEHGRPESLFGGNMIYAFVMKQGDNTATLLDDCEKGTVVTLVGYASGRSVVVTENVSKNHKVAIADIFERQPVIKGGISIGTASRSIKIGSWVHLHNCASRYDARHYEGEVRGNAAGLV
jgi:altronate dehydratase small subunit